MKITQKIDISALTYVHFIGIGGISMCALADYCLKRHIKVSGSDKSASEALKVLARHGAKISIGHKGANVKKGCDLVVFSGAIRQDNPEITKARELNIPVVERGEFLGAVSREHKKTIAISGTHGKSTTTAMVASILMQANIKATIHIGANSPMLKRKGELSNFVMGQDVFVTEACEYRENFLHTKNYIGVICNIEPEHLDYFKTYKAEVCAYKKFASQSLYLVCEYNQVQKLKPHTPCRVISVSKSEKSANFYAQNIRTIKKGGYIFDVIYNGKVLFSQVLNILGEHNITNALFAIAVAHKMGIENKVVEQALTDFVGLERRLENIGTINNTNFYLDYAHHPTEINSCINALKQVYVNKKGLYIFQPHTYSRTLSLLKDFLRVFTALSEDLIIVETYSAREDKTCGMTAEQLKEQIKKEKDNVWYATKRQLKKIKKAIFYKYDYVAFMGAGDIDSIAKKLILTRKNTKKT